MCKASDPLPALLHAMPVSGLFPWATACQLVSAATREKGHSVWGHMGLSWGAQPLWSGWRSRMTCLLVSQADAGSGYFSKGFGV